MSDGGDPHSQSTRGERGLAAVMFTDIAGYTSMTQADESLTLNILQEHRRILRSCFSNFGGTEVKTGGDSFLVEFRSALDAVLCAVAIQRAVSERNEASTPVMRFNVRIGVHVGDVVRSEGDVYGDTVNLASRIESLAQPGGIMISDLVYEQVRNKVQVPIARVGSQFLKNVEAPLTVYSVDPGVRTLQTAKSRAQWPRLAVLPLVNIGGAASEEYLADGITQELITALSHISGLRVVARTSVQRYRGSPKSISEIGGELGVGTILEGSVRRWEDRIRVNVELVDSVSEESLWTESYDRKLEDVLAVQEDIASKTADALKPRLGLGDAEAARKPPTTSPEAYLLYLQARHHLTRQSLPESVEAASLFEQATRVDPAFAAAYAMAAQCYMFQGFFGYIRPDEGFGRALPLLKRALELDEDLDVAHMLMGRLLMDKDWNWPGAEAEFRRAIALSPNSAEAHYRYALLLNGLLRTDEALAEVKLAEELDPMSPSVNQISGTILCSAGKYDQAIERFKRALEVEPRSAVAHNNLGLALCFKGERDNGVSEIRQAIGLDPRNAGFKADLCMAYLLSGRTAEAKELVAETLEASRSERVPPVALAGMYACLGERDRALGLLEEAFREHSPYMAGLQTERWFDGVRDDPRFKDLAARVGY